MADFHDVQQGKRDVLLVAIAVLILIGASGVVWQTKPKTSTEKQAAQIVEDPQRYYGESVTLTGNVGSILGSRAFTLDTPGVAANKLLVISKTPIEPIGGSGINNSMFQPKEQVQIKGHVEYFSVQKVENELNTDLVNNVYLPWEGQPAIVADSVQKRH